MSPSASLGPESNPALVPNTAHSEASPVCRCSAESPSTGISGRLELEPSYAAHWGALLTAVWLLGAIHILVKTWPEGGLVPNTMGDFAAGVAAPVAFLWLVLGYMQQGRELRLNTKALELQTAELANSVKQLEASVKQQQDLVAVSREQVRLEVDKLKHERSDRMEERALMARQAQPRLSLWAVIERKTVPPLYRFELTNAGHAISDVRLSITVAEETSHLVAWAVVERGENVQVSLSLDFEEAFVEVIYLDGQARPKRDIFSVRPLPGTGELDVTQTEVGLPLWVKDDAPGSDQTDAETEST